MRMISFTSLHNRRPFALFTMIIVITGGLISVGLAENQVRNSKPEPTQLKVSVNQTLTLDFSVPIKRAAIANDKVASVSVVSPKLVTVTGKTFGFTQLLLWNDQEEQMLYDVRVDVDMARLSATIHEAAPRANVKVSTMLDTVILSGMVPDAPTADRIVALAKVFALKVENQLIVAGNQQVMLRATVAEVSREAIRALGLNGTFFGAKAFGGSNVNQLNPTSIGLQDKRTIPIGTPNEFQVIGGDMAVNPSSTLYFGLPRAQMELFLQAMAENNLVKVLAEPNLVAISGQQAEFLAGGELPVPVPNENGIAIMYREYGVRLRFQPVVQAGQMIRLNVTSEVSEPDFTNAVQIAGYVVPGIHKRIAQTVVEIGSGQTFAIAGLLSESVRGVSNRVPGAGDIPILGALFRSVRYERSETELVIMITPDMVSPLNPNEVTYIPGQNEQSPNDWQLYGLGLIQDTSKKDELTCKEPSQPSFTPPSPLCGPWGLQQTTSVR